MGGSEKNLCLDEGTRNSRSFTQEIYEQEITARNSMSFSQEIHEQELIARNSMSSTQEYMNRN